VGARGDLYYVAAGLLGVGWKTKLREIQSRSAAEIAEENLQAVLEHAIATVPYYRALGALKPTLGSFPVLSRETLRNGFVRFRSEAVDPRRCFRVSTGGSTGEPVWVLWNREFQGWDHAADLYYLDAFCGMSPREYHSGPRVKVWRRRGPTPTVIGLAKRHVAEFLGDVLWLEPHGALTGDRMSSHLHRMNRHHPKMVTAYAASLFHLARHALASGIIMHRPRFIITSAETLFPEMRVVIEQVFRCKVHDMYGSVEAGRIAAECPYGNLHVLSFNNHVEILDAEGSPTAPGEVGRVVVTSLHNRAMPIIRYDIGDLASFSAIPCGCGSPLPVLNELRGRVVDYFVRRDGSIVKGGNFMSLFCDHDWILQFQIVQQDVDLIRVSYRVVQGREAPQGARDDLTRMIRRLMGEDCRVSWDEVAEIPPTAAGKHHHIRSLVWEEQTRSANGV